MCKACDTLKNLNDLPSLSIVMAHYDDFLQIRMTLESIRLHHAEVWPKVELIVVDNNPESVQGKRLRGLCGQIGAKYIPFEDVVGTSAPRDLAIKSATHDVVLCMDSHVMFPPGSLLSLLTYAHANRDSKDLWHGPLLQDCFNPLAMIDPEMKCPQVYTSMTPIWGEDLMFGKWGSDERGMKGNAEPFEIPMHGLGVFACWKSAWPGFPEGLSGFGGEEGNIQESFAQRGGKTLCLPFLRWWHAFSDGSASYHPQMADKCRNYLIWALHLGKGEAGVAEIRERFVRPADGMKKGNFPISPLYFDQLLESARVAVDPSYSPVVADETEEPFSGYQEFEEMSDEQELVNGHDLEAINETAPDGASQIQAVFDAPVAVAERPALRPRPPILPKRNAVPVAPAKCEHPDVTNEMSFETRKRANGSVEQWVSIQICCAHCGVQFRFPDLGANGAKEIHLQVVAGR